MPVASAEMLVAQAKEERRPKDPASGVPGFIKAPRRDKRPNPTTAGAADSARARMDYFIAGPPVALKRAASKSIPKPPKPEESSSFADIELDAGPYDEFILMSAPRDDWKYSIMTFKPANKDSKVDIRTFSEPIKLNRKNPTGIIYAPNEAADQNAPFKPQLGADGLPVYHNGQVVMVNAEGQTAASIAKAKAVAAQKGKGKANEPAGGLSKKKMSNKPKLKQTFKAADSVRQLRKEEYFPWVLEDDGNAQEWVGYMDGGNEKFDHALFSVDSAKGVFEFVPVHRFYKFLPKKQVVARMRAEEAHEMASGHMSGKKVDMVAVMKKRNGGKVSEATLKTQARAIKMEEKALRKPKREQNDDDLFGDRGRGDQEGDLDEMEYEEDVADDDEGQRHDEMEEDEEEKQTQARLKKEYKAANKVGGDDVVDSDEDMDFVAALNDDGKRYEKVLKKRGNGERQPEDEETEEEDEEEDSDDGETYYTNRYGGGRQKKTGVQMTFETGVQKQERSRGSTPTGSAKPSAPVPPAQAPVPPRPASTPTKSTPAPPTSTPAKQKSTAPAVAKGTAGNNARAGSPVSGAAVLAMRATTPRGNHGPARAISPPAGRAASPLAGRSGFTPASPPPSSSMANAATMNAKKRKDAPTTSPTFSHSNPAGPSNVAKKKKKLAGGTAAPGGDSGPPPIPSQQDVINFMVARGGTALTRELADHFRTKESREVMQKMVAIIKLIGVVEGKGPVTLKPEYM